MLPLVVSCRSEEITVPNWVVFEPSSVGLGLPDVAVLDTPTLGAGSTFDFLPNKEVSLIGLELSWSASVRELCSQAGLSVVIDDSFKDKTVDVSFDKVGVRDALDTLCLSYGDIAYKVERGLVTFDSSAVQNVSVIDPLYTDTKELTSVLGNIVGDSTSITSVGSSVVVGGTNLAVDQAQKLALMLGNNRPDLWVVDVVILSMLDQWQHNLGIDTAIGGVVQVSDGSSSVIEHILDGTWSVDYGGGIDKVVLRSSTVLLSGSSTSINSVEEIPVPLRTISPQGTVSITGYDLVSAGIKLTLSCVKVPDGLRVIIEPEISDVSGYVNDRPVVTKRNLETTVIVADNSIILLSGLWSDRESDNVKQLLALGHSTSSSEWVICARFKKIN